MPKLPADVAKATAEAEIGNEIEEGTYRMVLTAVTDEKNGKPNSGPKGPYWTWELTFPDDAPRYKRRKVWRNISLGEDAASLRREAYAAFGADPSVDTDDLIGKECDVVIGTRLYEGKPQVDVRRLLPPEGVVASTGKVKGKAANAADA